MVTKLPKCKSSVDALQMIRKSTIFTYRTDVEIGALLCVKGICSTHLMSEVFGYSQSVISRAVNRIREGKIVGKGGRNQYL